MSLRRGRGPCGHVVAGVRALGGPEPGVPDGLGQAPGPHLLGDGGIGEGGVEDAGHLAHEPVVHGLAAAGGQAPGVAGHRGDDAVPLAGQRAQCVAVQLLLGLREPAGQGDQAVELLGAVTGEEVGQPGCLRRATEPAQGAGQVAVARILGGGDPVVAGGDELVRWQLVQLVRDRIEGGAVGATGVPATGPRRRGAVRSRGIGLRIVRGCAFRHIRQPRGPDRPHTRYSRVTVVERAVAGDPRAARLVRWLDSARGGRPTMGGGRVVAGSVTAAPPFRRPPAPFPAVRSSSGRFFLSAIFPQCGSLSASRWRRRGRAGRAPSRRPKAPRPGDRTVRARHRRPEVPGPPTPPGSSRRGRACPLSSAASMSSSRGLCLALPRSTVATSVRRSCSFGWSR